ncbi:MAG: helix-turn-helix domain-containing protein [Clostridiales bacterium]|nr:helix-turn-helix domain-containing protein [Clostridiales bacterium]
MLCPGLFYAYPGRSLSGAACRYRKYEGNRRRIALAKEFLLQEENITIKELAQKVGFSNDVTFRRLFKKYEGLLPSEY